MKKVAITCDHLLVRNHYTEIIEVLCEIFPEAPIYTFAHKKGAILGRIEQRKIHSTYLSHKVNTIDEFYAHSSKLPLLAKHHFVSCQYDYIINVSAGLSQGFKKCESTKQITYLYDFGFEGKVKKSLMQKLAHPWFLNYAITSFKNADTLYVARENLKQDLIEVLKREDVSVMYPPFKLSDYSLFPKAMFPHHFLLIDVEDLNRDEASLVMDFLQSHHLKFQFIGPDSHLEALKQLEMEKSEPRKDLFFGERCSGEHAPVLAASKIYINFKGRAFPKLAFATLAVGRPVMIESCHASWFKGDGVFYFDQNKSMLDKCHQLIDLMQSTSLDEDSFDGQKLRSQVQFYHETKFKKSMEALLN